MVLRTGGGAKALTMPHPAGLHARPVTMPRNRQSSWASPLRFSCLVRILLLHPLSHLPLLRCLQQSLVEVPEGDAALLQIEGRHLHRHLVALHYLDPVHPQLSGQRALNFYAVRQDDLEDVSGVQDHYAVHLNHILLLLLLCALGYPGDRLGLLPLDLQLLLALRRLHLDACRRPQTVCRRRRTARQSPQRIMTANGRRASYERGASCAHEGFCNATNKTADGRDGSD